MPDTAKRSLHLGWIYAFKDRGFDRGIKIGRDGNHPTRFHRAQCYTPRGIDLVAVWRVPPPFGTLASAETTSRKGVPLVVGENSGAEWCDVTPDEAIGRVSENLSSPPEKQYGNPKTTTTYDDFRDPKVLGREVHRQLLWVYRENRTATLKVQRTSSWKVPQERVKTYSLLGFRPIACFGNFPEPDLRRGNARIHDVWVDVTHGFGYGDKHVQVGWLRPETDVDMIKKIVLARGLSEIVDWSRCPSGVRPGY